MGETRENLVGMHDCHAGCESTLKCHAHQESIRHADVMLANAQCDGESDSGVSALVDSSAVLIGVRKRRHAVDAVGP